MLRRGVPRRVGDLARRLAAIPHPILYRGVSTAPVLLAGYLETAAQCARANSCALCQREVDALAEAARAALRCGQCGKEPWRRLCRELDCGPFRAP